MLDPILFLFKLPNSLLNLYNKLFCISANCKCLFATIVESKRRFPENKKQKFKKQCTDKVNIIFVTNSFGGITDWFKGMVSLFDFCEINKYNFKIYAKDKFDFNRFFVTNSYNWTMSDWEYSEVNNSTGVLHLCLSKSKKKGGDTWLEQQYTLKKICDNKKVSNVFIHSVAPYGLQGLSLIYLLYYFKYHVQLSVACSNLSIFVSAFFISIITIILLFDIKNNEWNKKSEILLLISLLSMVNPAGSDSAFLKFVWGFVAFSPYIIFQNLKYFPKDSYYFKTLIFFILAYSIFQFYKKPMPCVPSICELNYEINDSRLANIKVSRYRYDLYNNVKNDLAKYDSIQVVFYGMQAHGLYYLNNVKNVLRSDFFMYGNNVNNAVNMVETVNIYKPIVFFMPYSSELTIVEDSLVAHGYSIVDENYCYRLYYTK